MAVLVQFLGKAHKGEGLSVSATVTEEISEAPDVFLSVKHGIPEEDVLALLDRIRAMFAEHGVNQVEATIRVNRQRQD